MTALDFEKCAKGLASRFPLIGPMRQRSAAARLAADSSAQAVPLLVRALDVPDEQAKRTAHDALYRLTAAPAVDRLCALWAADRHPAVGAMVADRKYVASKPVDVRVLSALKANRLDVCVESTESIAALAAALDDRDATLARTAEDVVRGATERRVVDALCALAIDNPVGAVARICVETGKRPSDPEDLALFLVVTRQLDAYETEDFEFQHLRPAFERASPAVRGHVMALYRTGDVRLGGFIAGARGTKPLTACTPSEIEHFIETHAARQNWPKLFGGFLDLPLEYGLPLLDRFRASGWEPDQPDLRSLYREALAEADAQAAPKKTDATSSVFARWLQEGAAMNAASETDLVKRLGEATPPDGVRLVAALAKLPRLSDNAVQAVRTNAHWLVRLAGYAVGLPMRLNDSSAQDPNYWVRELAQAEGVLKVWPATATPADLEQLDRAPSEATVGRLGAARRVLRLLMAYRITAPDLEPMTTDAASDAGEFEPA